MKVELYPDSSAYPGDFRAIAAWIAVVDGRKVAQGHRRCIGVSQGGGELIAAADAIQWALDKGYDEIRIYPDCRNVAEALQGRIDEYAARGWKKRHGRSPKDVAKTKRAGRTVSRSDLVEKDALTLLYAVYLAAKPILTCDRIPSHSGHPWNDAVDRLAKYQLKRWVNEGKPKRASKAGVF
jgi:ribonuclease HI